MREIGKTLGSLTVAMWLTTALVGCSESGSDIQNDQGGRDAGTESSEAASWDDVPDGVTYFGPGVAVVTSEDGSQILFISVEPEVEGALNSALDCSATLSILGSDISASNAGFVYEYSADEHFLNAQNATGSLRATLRGTVNGDTVTIEIDYVLNATLCKAEGTVVMTAVRSDSPCAPGTIEFDGSYTTSQVGQTAAMTLSAEPVCPRLCESGLASGPIEVSLEGAENMEAVLVDSEIDVVDGKGVVEVATGWKEGSATVVASSSLFESVTDTSGLTVANDCNELYLIARPERLGLRPGEKGTITVSLSESTKCTVLSGIPLELVVDGAVLTTEQGQTTTKDGMATFEVTGVSVGLEEATVKVADPENHFGGQESSVSVEVSHLPLRGLIDFPDTLGFSPDVGDVQLSGDILYAQVGYGRILPIDVTDPLQPVFGTLVDTGHTLRALAMDGTTLYGGYCDEETSSGVRFSVTETGVLSYTATSDIAAPLGSFIACPPDTCVSGLSVVAGRLLVQCDTYDLRVYDLSTTDGTPVALSSLSFSYEDITTFIFGPDVIYYLETTWNSSTSSPNPSVLHVLGVSAAGVLSEVGLVELTQPCNGGVVEGDTLRLACADPADTSVDRVSTLLLDVTTPETPTEIAVGLSDTTFSFMRNYQTGRVVARAGGTLIFPYEGDVATWFSGTAEGQLTWEFSEEVMLYTPLTVKDDWLFVKFDEQLGVVDLSGLGQ
jgi:hypothetical protein